MITLPIFLSLILYFSFMIYIFFGFYMLNNDAQANRKYVFFAICITLSIWSFSFSISTSAPDYNTALLWRRISAIGWGSMFSFLLHFIIILTDQTKWLKKQWLTPLIYFPALINIFIFTLYKPIAINHYHLDYTIYGWINTTDNSTWSLFFNLYYMTFTLVSIGLTIYWGLKSDIKAKKSARLLFLSFATALILGSATDIIFTTNLTGAVPQIAPVIIIIPIAAIFYSVRYYDLMKPKASTVPAQQGSILNSTNRKNIFDYLSLCYLLGGSLNFAISYFMLQTDFEFSLLYSIFLAVLGLAVQMIYHLKIKDKSQNIILVSILTLTIPLIILKYIDYAGITVWAIPFLFLILLIPFRNYRYIIVVGSALILTLVWVWFKEPVAMVSVNASDHFARIILTLFFLLIAVYVNKVFINRLDENDKQVRFQKMISDISTDFITTNEINYHQKIMHLLELCGTQYHINRANLFIFSPDMKTVTCTHEWCKDGIVTDIDKTQILHTNTIPWWISKIMQNSMVVITTLEDLPLEAYIEKKLFKKYQVQSYLSIPIRNNEHLIGFLGFDAVKNEQEWIGDYPEMLQIISNILADTLAKITAEKEIKYMAFYDSLTGLPNRTLFNDRLRSEISLASRTETFIGVVLLDLDSFKSVNDTMGHDAGDELLKKVAQRLIKCIRKYDTVCRFGGDEYLIMLPNIAASNNIHHITNIIMDSFKKPLKIGNQEFFITASAGVALYPIDGEDPDTLIKNADLAMYTSKDQGKNKYTLCTTILKEDILTKMKLTNCLYRALERNELVLYYQPQISLKTNKIIGVEALIRWHHPELGTISPATFIPLAEQHTGLIGSIGDWALLTACRQSMAWKALGISPLRMAVNLSGEQFRNNNLVGTMKRIITETGIKPEILELEITESVALKGNFNVNQVMNDLKSLGITIAIDDFGVEYSSLNRLKVLPIDRIKMDAEFVRGLAQNTKDEAIAKIIIQLAKNLDINVIAEGVENKSQLDFLNKQQCDEVQGFYFYKPMPPEELESILLEPAASKVLTLGPYPIWES